MRRHDEQGGGRAGGGQGNPDEVRPAQGAGPGLRPADDRLCARRAADAPASTDVLVVVGYRPDLVREALAGRPGLTFVEQTEQLGTGHAVMMCRDAAWRARRAGAGRGRRFAADAARFGRDAARGVRPRPAGLPAGHGAQGEPARAWAGSCATRRASFEAIVEEKDATPTSSGRSPK